MTAKVKTKAKVRHIEGQIRRTEARILSAKNSATQIPQTIASWPENEMLKVETGR